MEFSNRSGHPSTVGTTASNGGQSSAGGRKKEAKTNFILKVVSVILLFSATILVVAVLWVMVLGSPSSESKHVDEAKMQAVFLNGGQVYFGKIRDLNNDYLRVNDIYYLRVNQQVQPEQEGGQQAATNDISLVKLGCELHGPVDEMVINREQVVFWENLKTDGQVAKAVDEYKKQNPNGQTCEQPSQNTNTNTNTNTSTEENTEQ